MIKCIDGERSWLGFGIHENSRNAFGQTPVDLAKTEKRRYFLKMVFP